MLKYCAKIKQREGVMSELLTAAQMRRLEQAAIGAKEVTGLDLMERAGRGVVQAVFDEWPDLANSSYRALILCGPGNNGGDGFVVARMLKQRGWDVDVFLYGDADKLPSDARTNYERWMSIGKVESITMTSRPTPGPRLVIDAIFGTGTTRGLPKAIIRILRHIFDDRKESNFVGIDCFSGDDLDSGRQLGVAADNPFPKELTVSFHSPKVGHYLEPLAGRSHRLAVKDIGLSRYESDLKVQLASPLLFQLNKGQGGHKFSHGHALILTGGAGKTGAARLAARGALRAGAGLVTLGVPPAAQIEVACQITAIMLQSVTDADALREVLTDDRLNALCLGPGLGIGARTKDLVMVALTDGEHTSRSGNTIPRGVVLDADALTSFKSDPETLFNLLNENCVLTPHGGEFARLFPDISAKLANPTTNGPVYSKVDATRDAAARAGCVVLFKGPDTVIAAPDGQCRINSAHYDRAAPWLATAGSGDVLAGVITGLIARGFPAMQAAETGAWLHVQCARVFGPGLIAEDIPEVLPKVYRELAL
jgi:ADP-dependent NAD(P)H-hydrate dehydratase / NAD(P)H-hydrate epimerase